MIKTKLATVGLSLALVLGVSAPAGAVTVAELQAQINALMAQLSTLQGGTTTTAGYNFTQNLTLGSTGAEVVSLQTMLVAQGHLVMPAGVSMGYFGTLTQAAVAKWQAANGVSPAAGYFGPISRAKANTMGGTTTGGTTTGGTTTGGITTPGVEGTLTVTLASTPTSAKLYEGNERVGVMGIEIEAKLSDIKVERIKIKLDEASDSSTSDRDFYRKISDKLYIMNGSTVLASVDLNSDTVVEESTGEYYVTVTGVNFVVSKDTKKVLTVALDAMSTWDTAFDGDSWTVGLANEGVRGVDGAGINQFSPTTGSSVSRNFTSEAEAIAAATLKLSLNTNTPQEALVIASAGVDEDEKDGLELMKFDVKAEKDAVTITDLVATITRAGSGAATTTTVYLMDGSTVLDSATGNTLSATGGTVTFDSVDYEVSKDSTKTLRIVVDIRDANATAATYSASVTAAQITSENSVGDGVTESGSATGETLTVLNAGPEITLNSKSIAKTEIQFSGATSSAKATFNITLKAVGSDVHFGSQSASTTFAFQTYLNGSASTLLVASSTSWSVPSGVVTSGIVSGGFILQEGNSVTIPVEFLFEGRTAAAGTLVSTGAYAVGLENIKWASSAAPATQITTDFMSAETDWRTSTVTMP